MDRKDFHDTCLAALEEIGAEASTKVFLDAFFAHLMRIKQRSEQQEHIDAA